MEDSRGSGRRTWQDYARQRRQNMSEEQRQQHLARRCVPVTERVLDEENKSIHQVDHYKISQIYLLNNTLYQVL